MGCTFAHEAALLADGRGPVAGIDEAGRGALAGPVVAAAVILPVGYRHARLDDSKKLSPAVRSAIHDELVADARVVWAVGVCDAAEIDRINILRATHAAMRQAVLGLAVMPGHVLIDGLPVAPFPHPQTALVGGDGLSLSIAAASVIAKVTRDRMMVGFDGRYPGYGFAVHKGYATRLHLGNLRARGPSPIHRVTFAPVAQGRLNL